MRSILTVVTPAASQDLTTLATVKSELNITDNSQDAQLTTYIHQASGAIASYCNRVFGRETVNERFMCAQFSDALRLQRRPIHQITSITENGAALASSGYYVDKKGGLLHKAGLSNAIFRSYAWYGEILVDYQSGYVLLGDLPYEIERACIMLVTQFHSGRGRDPYIRSEDIPGVASYSYGFGPQRGQGMDMPPEVAALLSSHKEPCVA